MTTERATKLNKMYKLIATRVYTKQELQNLFDTSEREVRDMISEIAKKVPVISLSDNKGYRVAKQDFSDIKDTVHQLKDLQSRMAILEKRCEPLNKYIAKYMEREKIISLVELERNIS